MQDYDFERLLRDLRRIRSMGSVGYWIGRFPGLGGIARQLKAEGEMPGYLKSIEAIVCSMTPEERRSPTIIDGYRRERIARGSGKTHWDVAQVVRAFQQR
jgi:signal recognition particle subunit SRP54